MENQRTLLTAILIVLSAYIYFKWVEFSNPVNESAPTQLVQQTVESGVPEVPTAQASTDSVPTAAASGRSSVPSLFPEQVSNPDQLITVTTDIVVATINRKGGVIERLELIHEPVSLETPNQGFPLLKRNSDEIFVTEDGLLIPGQEAPNHRTQYSSVVSSYDLGSNEKVDIPLTWTAENGVQYTKTITFTRDSYVVDISYSVNNITTKPLATHLYAQFNRTEPASSGGGFGQLPSYTGGAVYEEENKYNKVKFGDMSDDNLKLETDNGWVAMLQHYFVGAWIPGTGNKTFFSSAGKQANPQYRIGYKTEDPVLIQPGQSGLIATQAFLGPKEQKRLNRLQEEKGIKGLELTVDYGWLTVISKPLFLLLNFIHNIVGNWGWSIVLTTMVIKAAFYPLSAASYKSMAGMKKLQPRMATLKERYKDDRQKFQMEMMAMYKKEKINPAGGCLPILIQIPVFLAFYWALLESVEMRQAPFALWWQDLSAPDPYYVLPVLMGVTQFLMMKLNPTPMEDIQKKVMMIMPFVLVFIFIGFPQGLVLYWVVNNILSMAQQWFINKKYAA